MKRYNINWTAKALYNQMNKGRINFDCSVQRGFVWDNDKKSLLIHSMLYGYAIPAFYLTKNEDGYDSLDGKQRSNTIFEFMNNTFCLQNVPIVYDDEENEIDINGMYFDELSEEMQDRIKDFNLTIYYFEDMTENEVKEFFRRINNGKPLTTTELTRVKAVSIDKFQEIAKHEAIQNVVTEKGKNRFNDENFAMQIYAMAYMNDLDFGTKNFRPYIQEVIVEDKQKEEIVQGLNYISNCIEWLKSDSTNKEFQRVLRKLKARTHFVSMAYYGILCNRYKINNESFNKTVFDFFNISKTSTNEAYNDTVGAGSAKASAVQKRKNIIDSLIYA